MKGISHKQAIQLIHRRLDDMLDEGQRSFLEEHLRSCDTCRAYSSEMELLPAQLQHEFHSRWDRRVRISKNLTADIQTQSRKLTMSKRIDAAFNTFGGVVTVLVLVFVLGSVVSRLQTNSTASNASQTDLSAPSTSNDRSIAFVAEKDGNPDIYIMSPDGTGLTNLTHHPALDVSPVWSPDGKRIAFESDRNGFRQIFLMNADGSNLVALTDDEDDQTDDPAEQWIGEPYDRSLNLWSPDGKSLIFLEIVPGEENAMLYIIDANGKNKKPLVKDAGRYFSPSWSPDGKYIAFIVQEGNLTRIYSIDANGNKLTDVTKKLPAQETLYPVRYSWSRDGQSISFIATNWNYLVGGGEGAPNYEWRAYEVDLEGNTLITHASTRSQIGGYWWDGSYFLSGSSVMRSSPAFTWVRSDGTLTTFNPINNCEEFLDLDTGGYVSGYSSYKQSPNGNVVIGGYCPDGDKWLFWADSKGTVKQLLSSPIHVPSAPTNAMHLWAPPDFIWSSDDEYIAFNIFTRGKTDMYIVDVADALKDPSIQPFKITIGSGTLYYSPVWQPLP